ncbi:MAG: hypothetical protein ACK5SX_03645 [Sandaracinobacter sp.]
MLILEHPEIALDQELRGIVSSYNEAVGGVNDSRQSSYETLTRFWRANARAFLAADPTGARDAALRHFGRDRLFSVAARLGVVEPDLMRFPLDIGEHAAPAPQL